MVYKSFDKEKYQEGKSKEEFTYEELLNKTFTWYPNNQIFNKKSFTNPMTNEEMISFTYNPYVDNFSEDNKIELKVVGILQPKANMNYGSLGSGFFYTPELTKYIL